MLWNTTKPAHSAFPHRRVGALLLGLGAGYLALFSYAVHPILPFNPIRLPYERGLPISLFIPEGWKFFTRNPQEALPVSFARSGDGEWRSTSLGPNAAPAHWFGLDRTGRAQSVELGLLLEGVSQKAWIQCNESSPAACLERAETSVRVSNISPKPLLCGTIGVVLQKPVPWAWARSGRAVTMPSRVVRLEVQC